MTTEVVKLDIKTAFGQAIKQIRISQNYSQENFALQIGMDRTYYASVELGHRNVSIQNIKKIADGFGIPTASLFEIVDDIYNESIDKERG